MAYSVDEKQKIFDDICEIIINGKSLRSALKVVKIDASTFFVWMREDEYKSKQYAQATTERAEMMFEDMFEIADEDPQIIETKFGSSIDTGHIQDKRVRIDTRKWALSKLMPKKYGEKIEDTTEDKEIKLTIEVVDPIKNES